MKVGDIMLSEKTKVGLSLTTLIVVLIFVITTSAAWGTLKATVENDIQGLKEDVESVIEDVELIKPALVQMSTDVGWMRRWMENQE